MSEQTEVSFDAALMMALRADLDLLRILPRYNLQHRQGVLVLFHYRPPRI